MNPYSSLAQWYDSLTRDVPYGAFADFYHAHFTRHGKHIKTVLDLGCGTGTISSLLASRGYELICADVSEDMLMSAREKFARIDNAPLFIRQDMASLDLYGTVDAAVMSLDVLNYCRPDKLSETFRRLKLFIEPGGLLIFDIHSPERLSSMDGQVFIDERDGLFCVWRAALENDRLVYGMDIFTQTKAGMWQRATEEHVEYTHEPHNIRALLISSGFRMVWTVSGPQSDEGRIHIAAVS